MFARDSSLVRLMVQASLFSSSSVFTWWLHDICLAEPPEDSSLCPRVSGEPRQAENQAENSSNCWSDKGIFLGYFQLLRLLDGCGCSSKALKLLHQLLFCSYRWNCPNRKLKLCNQKSLEWLWGQEFRLCVVWLRFGGCLGSIKGGCLWFAAANGV